MREVECGGASYDPGAQNDSVGHFGRGLRGRIVVKNDLSLSREDDGPSYRGRWASGLASYGMVVARPRSHTIFPNSVSRSGNLHGDGPMWLMCYDVC